MQTARSVKTIQLSYKMPDEAADALAGTMLDASSYDLLISGEDADVLKPDGTPLIKFRANVLPRAVCQPAYTVLRHAATEHGNRGIAAGVIRDEGDLEGYRRIGTRSRVRYKPAKRDGTLSNTNYSKPVASGIIGYFDRNPRFPYCRLTAFNLEDEGKRFAKAMPFIGAINAVFAYAAPDRYLAQKAIIAETNPDFYIHGTVFTTITVNRNWQTAVHQDAGDYRPGFGVMSVLQAGHYDGCFLCWPQYRVAADMRTGDVCLADVHEWHGNTPLVGRGRFERISCVFYYRAKMIDCGTAAEELERAKARPVRARP